MLADSGLQNRFDKDEVQSEIDLQVKVTQQLDINRQKLKKHFNEKIADLKQSGASQETIDNWQNAGLLVDGITGALYTPNANGLIGDVAQVASPQIAKQIGDYFANQSPTTANKAAHGVAHAVLAAAVAAAGGNDAITAGLSAGSGELAVPMIAKWMFGTDKAEKLTAEQKATVSNITSLIGTTAGATTGNTADIIASTNATTNAVDNNMLLHEKGKKNLTKRESYIYGLLRENGIPTYEEFERKLDLCDNKECVQTLKKELGQSVEKLGKTVLSLVESGDLDKNDMVLLSTSFTQKMITASSSGTENMKYPNQYFKRLDGSHWAFSRTMPTADYEKALNLSYIKEIKQKYSGKEQERQLEIYRNKKSLVDAIVLGMAFQGQEGSRGRITVGGTTRTTTGKSSTQPVNISRIKATDDTRKVGGKVDDVTKVNPHSLVLEKDKFGNEILYRTMSKDAYNIFLKKGTMPPSNKSETFISPSQAYSQGYEGVLVKITVKPGTMEQLKSTKGVAGNAGTKKIFPELNRAKKGWADNNQVQIKLEGKNKPNINNGQGVVNTGLGKSKGLDEFNENIIKFEKIGE